jgi:hypothetical protein
MSKSIPPPAGWCWAIGAGLIVFAARCREIHLFASETPFLDQWQVEGQQILVPWLKGQFPWASLFAPHQEHIPMWTRLLVWLEASLLGRWDPLLQCTINAGLWGATVGLWSHWFRTQLPKLPAIGLSLFAVVMASLPFGWENSTWGFQSHIPLALLFITVHIHGSFAASPFTNRWWVAQIAGLFALFTLGSMWAAPLAVLIVFLWTGEYDRRRWIPAALLSGLGLGLMLWARSVQPHEGALALSANSLPQFLAALLIQLGWPSQLPAAAAILNLPVILLAWQIRGSPKTLALDRIILAIGIWAMAQACAFALARSGSWIGFVSRYGDLLALGVLANAFALWRLLQGMKRVRSRILISLFTLTWGYVLAPGLQWVSTRAHTEYFHQQSALWSSIRSEAVSDYLATKSHESLSTPEVRNVLFPDPTIVADVLDTPGLSDLLPVQLRPNATRTRGDFLSASTARLRSLWHPIGWSGIFIFLLGIILSWRYSNDSKSALLSVAKKSSLPWLAGLSIGAVTLVFLWPMPLEFNTHKRWEKMLIPAGYIGPLSFLITTPTTYVVDNLTGGASLWPEDFRNTFYGTHIDGPSFTGSAKSSPFTLESPWLVIPIAGFPQSAGNSIGLRIEGTDSQVINEIGCQEPNPTSIGFWQVDVQSHIGQQARIVFNDGRTDHEGWIAAASPQPTVDKDLAANLNTAWAMEETSSAHLSLGFISALLIFSTMVIGFRDWRLR